MIIEAHPEAHPDIVELLTGRFRSSHDIELVRGQPRQAGDYPQLAHWDPGLARYAISEGRANDPLWLVLRPRGAHGHP